MTGIPGKRALPVLPHPDHLRKQAKVRLVAMKARASGARLAEAQAVLAREYGFASWAALLAEVARRGESPRGQYARIRRAPVAPLVPGFLLGLPPDDEGGLNQAFVRSGVIAQTGFLLAILAGVGLVLWTMHLLGMPFRGAR
ncbi:MAG: hypothetical protein BGN82_04385 [Alphaproteobacteria bacterium 65-7]|nr:MAG: hypothetical protein BGN82_04385 [Alphaproteobacteria bacterium 65-7]